MAYFQQVEKGMKVYSRAGEHTVANVTSYPYSFSIGEGTIFTLDGKIPCKEYLGRVIFKTPKEANPPSREDVVKEIINWLRNKGKPETQGGLANVGSGIKAIDDVAWLIENEFLPSSKSEEGKLYSPVELFKKQIEEREKQVKENVAKEVYGWLTVFGYNISSGNLRWLLEAFEKKFLSPLPKFKEKEYGYCDSCKEWGKFGTNSDTDTVGKWHLIDITPEQLVHFALRCKLITREEALKRGIEPPMVGVEKWEWLVLFDGNWVRFRTHELFSEQEMLEFSKKHDYEEIQKRDSTRTPVKVPVWEIEGNL